MTSTPHDRPSMPQPASPEYAHPLPSAPPLGASGIVLQGLTKQYQRGGVRVDALAGVNLSLPRRAQVAIMGPSGCGKTTLLHTMAGIVRPTSGSINVEGSELASLSDRELSTLRLKHFGFVFQDGQLLPELVAEENVAMPLMLAGTSRGAAIARAREVLTWLGMGGAGAARPGQLSGGQAQRVAIARALVASPQVVFADEPTGALDQATGHEVMNVLTSAARATGATLVLVTHDPSVASWFPATIHMRDGLIVDGPGAASGAVPRGASGYDSHTAPCAPAEQRGPSTNGASRASSEHTTQAGPQ